MVEGESKFLMVGEGVWRYILVDGAPWTFFHELAKMEVYCGWLGVRRGILCVNGHFYG